MAPSITSTLTSLVSRLRPHGPVRDGGTSTPAPGARPGAGDLDIRPAATEEEVQAIRSLVTQQIPDPGSVALPEALPHRHHGLHRELVGAWRHGDLVGAAFVGPSEQEADGFTRGGLHHDAETVLDNVAMLHDVAVEPAHRRTGVALALKHWVSAWAADHGAHLVISVPTTQEARDLNQAAGHRLLPPGVTLVMQVKTNGHTCRCPSEEGTTWSLRRLTEASRCPLLVGAEQPLAATSWGTRNTVNWDIV